MERAALARKYQSLLALRRFPDRGALAGLAAEFPGALRELDELPTAEIERRLDELSGEAPLRAELLAIGRFHDLLVARDASLPRAGRKPSRDAIRTLAAELEVGELEAHRLVFPFAHVRRGF